MTKEEILDRLSFSIFKADKEMAKETAQEIIKLKVDPIEAIEKGLSKGMDIVGERFSKMEAFLPELMMAAQTFDVAMEILEPEITAQKKKATAHGTIVMGTVKGDVHNIGKNIVAMVLKTGGFDVHNLGVDVSSLSFVEAASADLGADFLTIFFKVVLPIMFSAFVAGFVYTFMTTMMSLSSVIFLVTPGFDLASVYIYLTAQLGELSLASATTMKVIVIVAMSLGILKIIARKTRLEVTKKHGA